MAIALVAQTTGSAASGTGATPACTATGGNTLLALVSRGTGSSTGSITSFTDTGGNTWTLLTSGAVSGSSNTRIEAWVAENAVSPGTITLASATASTWAWNILEFSGVLSASSLDVASPALSGNASSTTQATPSITTTVANDVVVAAWHFGQTTTSGLTAGWTAGTNFDDAAVGSGRVAYQLNVATAAYSATLTLGAAKATGVLTLALQPASAGALSGAAAMTSASSLTAGASNKVNPAAAMASASSLTAAGTIPGGAVAAAAAMTSASSLTSSGGVTAALATFPYTPLPNQFTHPALETDTGPTGLNTQLDARLNQLRTAGLAIPASLGMGEVFLSLRAGTAITNNAVLAFDTTITDNFSGVNAARTTYTVPKGGLWLITAQVRTATAVFARLSITGLPTIYGNAGRLYTGYAGNANGGGGTLPPVPIQFDGGEVISMIVETNAVTNNLVDAATDGTFLHLQQVSL